MLQNSPYLAYSNWEIGIPTCIQQRQNPISSSHHNLINSHPSTATIVPRLIAPHASRAIASHSKYQTL
ncbi:MAG: hypothetical protein WCF82_02245 [Microcoleus sp.]